MNTIRRFTQGHPETVQRLNQIVDALNSINNFMGDGLIRVQRSPSGYTFSLNMDGVNARAIKNKSGSTTDTTGTQIRRAKIQSIATAAFVCKLLDANGNTISTGGSGDDGLYNIAPIEHLGANPLSGSVWPKLAIDDIISVFLDIGGGWFTTFPFDDTESC